MSAEEEVRRASEDFYVALNRMANGDANSLADIWSHSEEVTAMHPVGGRHVGWHAIRESFEKVSQLASGGNIALHDQLIQVAGDVAYEVGVERGELTMGGHQTSIDHRVTNLYHREAGTWKMIHHHTDISPEMLEVLSRLQAEQS
ncbi:YybH family protein [Halomonas rhizosphaerae]|uniref:Nuclear transport factor 2 family protein n=1 Tax=Halomonas rhizosphaerae TaxID=3043296 RepID=A0ABT6V0T3_9GAMM|nr:nuclear transport factor 2 family protein [Halomonas rhizosphaerae]MDI5891840.1 nuclear transport factor 2 family protein [Halomonas rhizosphaerae]